MIILDVGVLTYEETRKGALVRNFLTDGSVQEWIEPAIYYEPNINGEFKNIYDEKFEKIEVKFPKQVKKNRTEQSHQADIPFVDKVMSGIKNIKPDISELSFDIEVDTELKDKRYVVENPQSPVIAISIVTDNYACVITHRTDKVATIKKKIFNKRKFKLIIVKDERKLFSKFTEIINGWFDSGKNAITGWNIERYDLPYMRARATYLKMSFKLGKKQRNGNRRELISYKRKDEDGKSKYVNVIYGIAIIDSFKFYKRVHRGELRSYSLDYVCKHEDLKFPKTSLKMRVGKAYRKRFKDFIIYNLCDSLSVQEIYSRFIGYYKSLMKFAGCRISKTCSSSKIFDQYLVRYCNAKNIVLATSGKTPDVDKEGAYVFEPIAGVFYEVIILDYNSFYPNIIITFNISPDTYIRPEDLHKWKPHQYRKLFNGHCFLTREVKIGIIPEVAEAIMNFRKVYQKKTKKYKTLMIKITDYKLKLKYKKRFNYYDELQFSAKTTNNSAIGCLGYKHSRIFHKPSFESCTQTGARLNKILSIDFKKKHNAPIIRGDTDSLFFKMSEEEAKLILEILDISEYFRKICTNPPNSEQNRIVLSIDKVFTKLINLSKKKKYFGKDENGELYQKGLDRSDHSVYGAKLQDKLMNTIINFDGSRLIIELNKVISKANDEFFEQEFTDIGLPTAISKPLDEYFNNEQRVRAAKFSNKYFGTDFGEFSKGVLLHVIDPRMDVVIIDDSVEESRLPQIDYQRMWQLTYNVIVEPLTELFGYRYTNAKIL